MIYIIRLRSILCVLLGIGVIISITVFNLAIPTIATKTTNKTVIIDAGHGGGDPGAIGISGSIEKEINLNISLNESFKYFFKISIELELNIEGQDNE